MGKNFSQDQINWEKKKHACVTNTITLRLSSYSRLPILSLFSSITIAIINIISILDRIESLGIEFGTNKVMMFIFVELFVQIKMVDVGWVCWWETFAKYESDIQIVPNEIASHLVHWHSTAMKWMAVCCYWCSCLFQMEFRWQVVSGPCDRVWNCKQKQIPIYEMNADKI